MSQAIDTFNEIPQPSPEELVKAYQISVRSRGLEERIIRLVRTGEVKFAIWGAGEEIHGTATALALSRFVGCLVEDELSAQVHHLTRVSKHGPCSRNIEIPASPPRLDGR